MLASVDLQPVLAQRLERFQQDFPEVTWQVKPAAPTPDGRPTLTLRVRGVAESEGLTYALEASEEIAIRLDNGQLVEQELLTQQSLLRSGERPLAVKVAIPDVVLTGSRYDVDLIVEEPLGQALVAGGLINLTDEQLTAQIRPNVPLAPLGWRWVVQECPGPTATWFTDLGCDAGASRWGRDGHQTGAGGEQQLTSSDPKSHSFGSCQRCRADTSSSPWPCR